MPSVSGSGRRCTGNSACRSASSRVPRGGTCISLWTGLATHRSNPIWKAVLNDDESGDHEELLTAIMHVQNTLDEIRRWKSDCKKAAESGTAPSRPPRWSVPDWALTTARGAL